MKFFINQIGISALSILLATATCNNTATEENNSAEELSTTETPTIEPIVSDTVNPVSEKRDTVKIETSMGNITVVLYNETPLHHDNFLKLVKSNYYDGILFHRVIRDFMIQTGDPNSKDADPNNDGMGGPDYLIPAEINPKFKHNKGALAAARTDNPERASSGSQFYICHAASPWLDGQYTIFGETIAGLDVVDKIGTTPTGPGDRPVKPVKIIHMTHLNAPKAVISNKKGNK